MDKQALALKYKIEYYLTHEFKNSENRRKAFLELKAEFIKLNKFSIHEYSQEVWDSLNEIASDASIFACNE